MRIIFKAFIVSCVLLHGMGSQFLVLPFSSQELSIGSHPTLLDHDPVNPALYHALSNQSSLSFNHGTWFGDVSLTQAGYNFRKNDAVTHVGFKYSGISDLEFRGDVPVDNPLAQFSSFGFALDAGISITRSNQRYGFSIAYVHFGLYTYESKGLGLNYGYSLDLDNNIRIGAVLQNIGKMTKLQNEVPSLPQRAMVGVSKQFTFNQFKNTVYTSFERNSLAPNIKLHIGNHLRWNRFNLYSGFSSSNDVLETSIGFGLYVNRFEVKYGIRIGSQNIGTPQIISIGFLL